MALATDIQKIKRVISELLMEEFEAQGHKMTGKLIDEINYETEYGKNSLTITGRMYPYGNILNRGVAADKIPFSGTGKRGGTSLYIKALQKYAQLRMNITDERESLGVAFAIAHKQRKEGMPSQGSSKYSTTGSRTEWIETALQKGRLSTAVFEMSFNSINYNIDTLVKKWNVELNQQ